MQGLGKHFWVVTAIVAVAALALENRPPSRADAPQLPPPVVREPARVPAMLPARAVISEGSNQLFAPPLVAPPIAPSPPAPTPPPPIAPAMPYRFAGHMMRDGVVEHFLIKGEALLPVKEGDTLDGSYRVEAVAAEEVTLLYVPLGIRTLLPLASAGGGGPGMQGFAGNAAFPSIPKVTAAAPQSPPLPAGPGANPIITQVAQLPATAAPGSRAAHLRRERSQQLPPVIP